MNINMIWHILQFSMFAGLGFFFTYKVFSDHLKVSGVKMWAGLLVNIILLNSIVCLFLTQESPFLKWSLFGGTLGLVQIIVMYKIFIDKKPVFLFSMLFIFWNIQNSSFYLARATLDFSDKPLITLYEYGDLLVLSSVYCVFLFVIVYILLAKYYKRIVDDNIIAHGHELFLMIPVLCYVSTVVLAVGLKESYTGIGRTMLLPFLLLDIFNYAAYYAVLKSVIDNFDAAAERGKLYLTEIQLKMWETEYESLKEKVDADVRTRQEWCRHIIAIMGYTEKGDADGLKDYLADYKEKYLLTEREPVCDIQPLNMLFHYYQGKAEELGICLTVGKVLFGDCAVTSPELIILFGNLLENAMEACGRVAQEERMIRLEIRKERNKIILLCENSYDGLLSRKNNRIVSRKKDGGMGITSIEGIVKKYGGQIKIEHESKVFRVWAFMQNTDKIM